MKKLIAIVALLGILMVQTSNVVMAQDAAGTEEVVAEGEGGITLIKRYFIEGDYVFMSLPLLCLILGLAFCIERIITLSLADVNTKKLLTGVESAIGNKDVEKAKQICKATRGPVASIMYPHRRRN
jgi:biopolymer transport protein ExbB